MYDIVVRNGNYKLHFLTEKQLSASDLKIVLAKYMEKNHLKSLPTSGENYYTVPVLDSVDYLQ